ncbi:uncharacterized protein F13E9.13, mitochondrial-like [Clytia hemisphaerica]|uniref:BtpA domain containing protein n=1 Tax=Clytia hemisphaerica TaxID=252671 RepID=A0A7M5UWN2_9CNID|eukprot:TCONS_00072959-protein
MEKFLRIFSKTPSLIGMIHVRALPGTPLYKSGSFDNIVDKAKEEAQVLIEAGIDGLMIENMHDIPYMNRSVGPEIISSMTVISHEVKNIAKTIPCGIQILSGCNQAALAVAKAASLQYIRAEGFVFAHVADEGIIQSDAGSLLRYRKSIDADDIMIWTDIKKKHSSHQITSDVSLSETCHAAEFFLSDGLIITGSSTGQAASVTDLKDAVSTVSIPAIIGSGISPDNVENFSKAHAMIVGSYFKKNGLWSNEICMDRLNSLVRAVTQLQNEPQR